MARTFPKAVSPLSRCFEQTDREKHTTQDIAVHAHVREWNDRLASHTLWMIHCIRCRRTRTRGSENYATILHIGNPFPAPRHLLPGASWPAPPLRVLIRVSRRRRHRPLRPSLPAHIISTASPLVRYALHRSTDHPHNRQDRQDRQLHAQPICPALAPPLTKCCSVGFPAPFPHSPPRR